MKISVTHKLAVCRFQLWLLLDIFGTAISQSGQQTFFLKSPYSTVFSEGSTLKFKNISFKHLVICISQNVS